jgi:hypothetical protein
MNCLANSASCADGRWTVEQDRCSPHPCAIHGAARTAEKPDSTALGRRSLIRMRALVQVQPGPPDRLSPAEIAVGGRFRSRVLACLLAHSGHRAHYSRANNDPAGWRATGAGFWDGSGGSARPMPRKRGVSGTVATLIAGRGRAGAPPQPLPPDLRRRAWRGCGRRGGWPSSR